LLKTRILTGVALAILVLAAVLLLKTAPAALVFGLIWLIGAGEWAALANLGKPGRIIFGGGFGLFVVAVIGLGLPDDFAVALLWLAVAIWLLAFVWVLRFPPPLPPAITLAVGFVVLSAAWIAFYLLHGAEPQGPGLVLAGLFIVWSADVGAYFTGRSIGRTPLAPHVSPKKTWEGVAGGMVLAGITGSIAARIMGLPVLLMIGLAGASALVSVVGDLGISMLKRWAGKKDSGVLLPGHGGILDRFDGVTAALPFYALGLQFAHVLD
jgi:phosphatidate cytidylyltransferase